MLKLLQINNIAVIRSAEIEFGGRFSALTGETGAGKSIIVDSIALLLGSRAPRELIRTGEERATVTALFSGMSEETLALLDEYGIECPDGSLLLGRTVSSDGRSTARINGRSVTQTMLREVGRTLLSIHGQHDNQKLLQKSSHISLLDSYAGLDEQLSEYRVAYSELCELDKEIAELRTDEAGKMRLRDMLAYQINEIDAARLKVGEEEELRSERVLLQNAERIKNQTDFAYRALHGSEKGAATLLLDRSAAAIRRISDVIPEADDIASRLENFRYEIEDIAASIRAYSDTGEGDPTARLDKLEGRLDLINRLGRKYGGSVSEILAFRAEAAARLESIEHSEEKLTELNEKRGQIELNVRALAEGLSEARRRCAANAAAAVCEELKFLDMPGVIFETSVRPAGRLRADGADEVEFLISSNPGEPAMPMAKIASGGELSRIMLALGCVLSANDGITTMIFDEIDTGISGKTSRKVGIKLREISRTAQVLCVTHSAQIASLADEQFLILKSEVEGRAETAVERLSEEGRIDEIARILGGINITEKQREAARELIYNK